MCILASYFSFDKLLLFVAAAIEAGAISSFTSPKLKTFFCLFFAEHTDYPYTVD